MRRHSEEVRPVLPTRVPLINHPQKCLMDESAGLQRVVATFVAQIDGGKAAEFGVDKRGEPVEGLLVTIRPLLQELVTSWVAGMTHPQLKLATSRPGDYITIVDRPLRWERGQRGRPARREGVKQIAALPPAVRKGSALAGLRLKIKLQPLAGKT